MADDSFLVVDPGVVVVTALRPGDTSITQVHVRSTAEAPVDLVLTFDQSGDLAAGANPLEVSLQGMEGDLCAGQSGPLLSPGGEVTFDIVAGFPRDAGNEYQGASATGTVAVSGAQVLDGCASSAARPTPMTHAVGSTSLGSLSFTGFDLGGIALGVALFVTAGYLMRHRRKVGAHG